MAEPYATKPTVEVNGTPLADDVDALVDSVVVEDHVTVADMVAVRLHDPARTALRRAGLELGATVRVSAVPFGGGASEQLFSGELTTLEADIDATGTHMVARGYDGSHRLSRGRRTQTYRNVTDADLARTIARRGGLSEGRIEETAAVHKQVSQAGVTDLEFIRARARRVGFVTGVSDGRLYFCASNSAGAAPEPGDYDSRDPLQLVMGTTLDSFHVRLTSGAQVSEVEVRGWDPARKAAVVASARAGTESAALATSPAALAERFGSHRHVDAHRSLDQQADADAIAKGLAGEIGARFAEAEGVASGDPRLRAGRAVSVARVGEQFEGRYTLSGTRHVFDGRGYRTRFTISGRAERGPLGLTGGAVEEVASPTALSARGVATAIVTDIGDPDGLARVKVRLPWLADDYETDWTRVAELFAGGGRGSVFLPEVGDEVLVGFEHGDLRRPMVLGGLFNGRDHPRLDGDLVDAAGKVHQRGLRSGAGHRLLFVEGGATPAVELAAEGDLSIRASGRLELHADGGVELHGDGGVEIDGGARDVAVRGTTIRLN